MKLQDIYPDNWNRPLKPIHAYEGSAIQILAEGNLMPEFTDAQEIVFRLPGAAWEPSSEKFTAAVGRGWARIDPAQGGLGLTLTSAGWAERKRLFFQMKTLCERTEVKKIPGWEGIPGHMMVA